MWFNDIVLSSHALILLPFLFKRGSKQLSIHIVFQGECTRLKISMETRNKPLDSHIELKRYTGISNEPR